MNLVLQDKDYNAAIPAFARFITQYPRSTYVPNAHYWLGQLLFAQNVLTSPRPSSLGWWKRIPSPTSVRTPAQAGADSPGAAGRRSGPAVF
ncbi:hypothetical protein MBH78_15875 [Oceanimonas sp. NS1]|nr:hypothetical protein [Oceanimonas sp. NS1]